MNKAITIQKAFIGALVLVMCSVVWANKTADTSAQTTEAPHHVVEHVTTELLQVASAGKSALDTDPDKYFSDVREIMETAVDFKYIARNVMGKKYWRAASSEQKDQFIEVFTSGLVQTYAKGMANFADFEVSVQAPEDLVEGKNKVEVIQRFKGPNGVNRVAYTMGKNKKSGAWKLINVVLDGVNLGKTLRAQFSQSVNESEGDLDAAIKGWTFQS